MAAQNLKHGWPLMRRYKGVMPASHQFNLDEARKLWADGKDTKDIAKHFSCDEDFVYHMLANGALKKKIFTLKDY